MNQPHRLPTTSLLVATIAVMLVVAYPLSIGPAAWAYDRWETAHGEMPEWVAMSVQTLYFPVIMISSEGPEWLSAPMQEYLNWWTQG